MANMVFLSVSFLESGSCNASIFFRLILGVKTISTIGYALVALLVSLSVSDGHLDADLSARSEIIGDHRLWIIVYSCSTSLIWPSVSKYCIVGNINSDREEILVSTIRDPIAYLSKGCCAEAAQLLKFGYKTSDHTADLVK